MATTTSCGIYGTGKFFVRWIGDNGSSLQTTYCETVEQAVELLRKWRASGDGKVTASKSVREFMRQKYGRKES
jgi:hypothetical protein